MRLAVELKSCRYVNIKPPRVGGLQASIDIHNLARENGIPAWVGGMLESSLGKGVNLELATLDNFSYPNDIGPSSRGIKEDITEPILEFPGKAESLQTLHGAGNSVPAQRGEAEEVHPAQVYFREMIHRRGRRVRREDGPTNESLTNST